MVSRQVCVKYVCVLVVGRTMSGVATFRMCTTFIPRENGQCHLWDKPADCCRSQNQLSAVWCKRFQLDGPTRGFFLGLYLSRPTLLMDPSVIIANIVMILVKMHFWPSVCTLPWRCQQVVPVGLGTQLPYICSLD